MYTLTFMNKLENTIISCQQGFLYRRIWIKDGGKIYQQKWVKITSKTSWQSSNLFFKLTYSIKLNYADEN